MGTVAWNNWRAQREGAQIIETFEDELHSDRIFVGEPIDLGPFRLSTVHRWHDHPPVALSLVLEGTLHDRLFPDLVIDGELVPTAKDDYYGGSMSDELASLVSLELGVRLRYAGTRLTSGFNGAGPFRTAVAHFERPGQPDVEVLAFPTLREPRLDRLQRIHTLPTLAEKDQRALVRAAVSYASALWWANQDPGQAWLQLVTAVEIAAKHSQSKKYDHLNVIALVDPDLHELLTGLPERPRMRLAKKLAPALRASLTFRQFVASHAPEPPTVRSDSQQVDWDTLESAAKKIYAHRSDWLHNGVPFPLPLIDTRPHKDAAGVAEEVPSGHSVGGMGGVWLADEYPMTLSMFEYIARGVLLRWWDELIDHAGGTEPAGRANAT